MINLLPQPYKESLRYEERFRLVVVLGSLGIIFLVCLSLLFATIRVYASGSLGAQNALIAAQERERAQNASPADQIRMANTEIAGLASFYDRQILLADVLEELARALPDGARITSLMYRYSPPGPKEEARGKLSLQGFALATEDLSALRDNLEANPVFLNAVFPPSNWVDSANITFSFTVEIKKQQSEAAL